MDRKELAARLFASRDVALKNLFGLFPNGRLGQNHDEFLIGSVRGETGAGLVLQIPTGAWEDKAEKISGEDFISLYGYAKALTIDEAIATLSGASNGSGQPGYSLPVLPFFNQPRGAALEVPPEDADRNIGCFAHPQFGLPDTLYHYLTRDGSLWYVQAKYRRRGNAKPPECCWIWRGGDWRADNPPKPRPLYGLDRLDPLPEANCLVVDGEAAADAAKQILKDRPVLTWWGEATSIRLADWEPLRGRKVLVWGRADETGHKAVQLVCNLLLELECEVAVVDLEGLAEGTDAATLVAQGQTPADIGRLVGERKRPYATQPRTPPAVPAPAPRKAGQSATAEIWSAAGLALDYRGVPHYNDYNVSKILDHAESMDARIEVWWDSFLCRKLYRDGDGNVKEWGETMGTRLTAWIQNRYSMPKVRNEMVARAVDEYAERRSRNCLLDWLTPLVWDKTPRLARLLPLGFGTVDNAYTQAVGRCFLMGMVARAMKPGCKVDCMPVFEGKEGMLKTSAIKIIGGDWYSEVHDSILSKDFMIGLQGVWLIEISELASFRRGEMAQIKGRISDPSDRFRAPYARHTRQWPRQCVMAGTTNEKDWATDDTGARRFWPVACEHVDLNWIRENREQMFAEALERFRAGEAWHDVPAQDALAEQAARHPDDPWLERIREYTASRNKVRVTDVLDALEIPMERRTMSDARRVGVCLRQLSFKSAAIWVDRTVFKGFLRVNETAPVDESKDF